MLVFRGVCPSSEVSVNVLYFNMVWKQLGYLFSILKYMKITENEADKYRYIICSMWYKRDGETFHTFFPKKWIDEDPRLNQTVETKQKNGVVIWNIFYPEPWENDGILTSIFFNLAWKFHHLEKHRQVFVLLVLCFWGDRIRTTQKNLGDAVGSFVCLDSLLGSIHPRKTSGWNLKITPERKRRNIDQKRSHMFHLTMENHRYCRRLQSPFMVIFIHVH